ncbi:MAG: 4Fe-4S dicluster domain-containing protein [Desulfovibrio sp.]|mgnify:CR=1 FL=1|nr:MAG: 4Fe-4S dicluster domain-containing protein [Desulfovibrio sp.]
MPRVEFIEERCKGCLLCATVCPVEIIEQSDRFNSKGYKVAEVSAEKMEQCTGCRSCALICPDFAVRVYKPAKAEA